MKEEREATVLKSEIEQRKREEKADKEYKQKLVEKMRADKEARAKERRRERGEAETTEVDQPEAAQDEPAAPMGHMAKAKAAAQERKRADEMTKKATLDRIAADRARRKAEVSGEASGEAAPPTTSESTSPAVVATPYSAAGSTKLAFRLPNGRTVKNSFAAGDSLQSTVPFVDEALGSGEAFRYAMTFPRRVFEAADMNKTLAELQLVPSAALEVQLIGTAGTSVSPAGVGGVAAGDGGIVSQLIALLIWLFTTLNPMNWIGSASAASQDSSQHHRSEPAASEPTDAGSTAGSRPQPSQASRRGLPGSQMAGGGRKVTLASLDRDPQGDTNERWNGDSTNLE